MTTLLTLSVDFTEQQLESIPKLQQLLAYEDVSFEARHEAILLLSKLSEGTIQSFRNVEDV